MADGESIKKMLRSVLQASKEGVRLTSVMSEYRSLCGESIPLKKLGFSNLEDYLRSIPSVVQIDFRKGELRCFAAVCKETAHIAELVARQRSSKKSGLSHVVNCKMRFKPSNPYMLTGKPRSSLRQPSVSNVSNWLANRPRNQGGYRACSASGDYRQLDKSISSFTPVEHRQPATKETKRVKQFTLPERKNESMVNNLKPRGNAPEKVFSSSCSKPGPYDRELVQSRLSQLMEKYSSGLWLSKLSEVYSKMFNHKLHPQAIADLEKWTHICMVEQPSLTNRADRLIYPPPFTSPRPPPPSRSCSTSSALTTPTSSPSHLFPNTSSPLTTPTSSPSNLFPNSSTLAAGPTIPPKSPLAKPTFIFPAQCVSASSVNLRSPAQNPSFAPKLPLVSNTANATACSPDIQPHFAASESVPDPPSESSAAGLSAQEQQRIKELLSKCSQGLWAHALPKLFMDTYKAPFPEHALEDLSPLLDICSVEFPISHDKKKAILYKTEGTDRSEERPKGIGHPIPSGLEVVGSVVPASLVPPSGQYPSVLVTDAKSSNTVTVRYVGEDYSNAQEAMEDAMRTFYNQDSAHCPLSNPVVGQLVAVRGEDGEELARAQVTEVKTSNKIMVYYVDHGFSVETSVTSLFHLHGNFLSLPFQASNVRLAGLEPFSSQPAVLSLLDTLAVGKILLMETLEPRQQSEVPEAVLYDTSQDDEVNINSACLRALQDETMNNPLTVNTTYQNVSVTNVCADGIIHCELPSRGTARLSKLLQRMEVFFTSQTSSESLVSRPFIGKFCLARHKGKWSRVEITSLYGSRVTEVLFIDLGIPATVEVTELREIPPDFHKDFAVIPPQAIRCRLADLVVPDGGWSPKAVLWVKEAILGCEDCRITIKMLEQHKGEPLVYMYLFTGTDCQELDNSVNVHLARSELWINLMGHQNNNTTDTRSNNNGDAGLTALVEKLTLSSSRPRGNVGDSTLDGVGESSVTVTNTQTKPLSVPPQLELPQPGQNMDVFVPVVCHPGYFVLQPWQDLHKLVVLMGEMMLHYNQTWKTTSTAHIQKGEIYAAKIDKNWHRVLVKGILANGFVSLYELDHGKLELVRSAALRPLIEEFRQLPFQAITAQLAGVKQQQWSEEACMLFRNHVEKKALVAQVESVQAVSEVKSELWEPRMTVYLVDTATEDKDLWIHDIMDNICQLD